MNETNKRFSELSSIQYLPISIKWDDDTIFTFLIRQYERGNQEASQLLYLLLHKEIRVALRKDGIDPSDETSRIYIVDKIKELSKYPDSVRALMLGDLAKDEVDFSNAYFYKPHVVTAAEIAEAEEEERNRPF